MRWPPLTFGIALVVAGFAVRLALVLLLRDISIMPQGDTTADDMEFNTLALNVARGEGFTNVAGRPTSFRAPGWSLFMAGLYTVCGERSAVVYLASCLLGGLSCLFTYLIGRRLMSERLARIAGLLCVVFVPHAYFAVMFWSENLFVPLFAAAVWVLLVGMGERRGDAPRRQGEPCGVSPRVEAHGRVVPSTRGLTPTARLNPAHDATRRSTRGLTPHGSPVGLGLVGLAGLLLGAAALTRPFALLAVPLFALVLLGYGGWRGFVAGTLLGVCAAGVVLPWTYRNFLVHHRFVPIATNGGSTFYGGNNDRVVTEWRLFGSWVSTVDLPGRDLIDAAPDEVSHDGVEWRLGREWVARNPAKALTLLPLKVARLLVWLPDFDGGKSYYYLVRAGGSLPFLALVAFGVWRGWGTMSGPGWWLLHASMLATVLTALIFWGSPRFRDANAPLLLVYAALAFARRDELSKVS